MAGDAEAPDMPYEDDSRTIFLYTKGEEGNPPQDLRDLLRYMEDTRRENAVNDTLWELDQMVNIVKQNREVSIRYMKQFERERMIREEERINTRRERERAEQESRRADREYKRAENAEREVAKLKAELEAVKAISFSE